MLVYEESGCSMSAAAAIAYLVKKKNMLLTVSLSVSIMISFLLAMPIHTGSFRSREEMQK